MYMYVTQITLLKYCIKFPRNGETIYQSFVIIKRFKYALGAKYSVTGMKRRILIIAIIIIVIIIMFIL